MKNYTVEERDKAKKALYKPVSDFISSDTLLDIYQGIIEKNKLNLRQAGSITEIVNNTLLGLEPESALETNIHQALAELSAATTREIVADINDRVFKETRRRVQENITETKDEWDEDELGQRPVGTEVPTVVSDAELDALAAKEEKEGWKPPEEKYVPPQRLSPVPPEAPATNPVSTATVPISKEKLATAGEMKTQSVQIQTQTNGIQNIIVPKAAPLPAAPAGVPTPPPQQNTASPNPAASSAPRIYKGHDPYREIPE
jgi:hypothetical protein